MLSDRGQGSTRAVRLVRPEDAVQWYSIALFLHIAGALGLFAAISPGASPRPPVRATLPGWSGCSPKTSRCGRTAAARRAWRRSPRFRVRRPWPGSSSKALPRYGPTTRTTRAALINGQPGFLVYVSGLAHAAVIFEVRDGLFRRSMWSAILTSCKRSPHWVDRASCCGARAGGTGAFAQAGTATGRFPESGLPADSGGPLLPDRRSIDAAPSQ